jgi:pyruvate dehydrogenase E2 component (dihydrolipoamide acetyltransferase)
VIETPYTALPMSALRKVIAVRMSEAKRTIPHFRLVIDVAMDALLALRERLNAAHAQEKSSINDCLIKACAASLMEHPMLNSQLVDEEIRQFHHADISVIVAVEGGVASPIVRAADTKSVREIALEVRALAARASQGQLRMNEIIGGSFSISNLGAHGIDQFDAIINPPQCAILAVGCVRPRVIVTEHGATAVAKLLRATLCVDHRVIDGATAARFLATLRRTIEQPQTWLAN